MCDIDWQGRLAQRMAEAVTEPIWLRAEESWNGEACDQFEGVADALDALPEAIHTGLGRVAEALATSLGAPEWAARIIGWLVASVTLPYEQPLLAAAQVIRAFGVALCVEHGQLSDCACLPGLAHAQSDAVVAERVERPLNALVSKVT